MIPIDKGIEMPPRHTGHGRPRKYPWREMLVGDSFFTERPRDKFSPSVVRAGKLYGRKFSARVEGAGTRVWRIA